MNAMPGFAAGNSVYETDRVHTGLSADDRWTVDSVVPQLPTSRACNDCSGFFYGSHTCCDIEIVSCTAGYRNCVVNFNNCQTESCGLLAPIIGWLF
jgi:hypothetical protein